QTYHYITTASGQRVEYRNTYKVEQAHSAGADGEVAEGMTETTKWSQTITDVASGQVVAHYDSDNLSGYVDNRDWFQNASDFAAGMGDAVSCGLTQRIRAAAGYDDVVDKNSGYYKGGQVAGTVVAVAAAGANPCGAAKGIAMAVRGLSAVQGTGQLVNAAEAA